MKKLKSWINELKLKGKLSLIMLLMGLLPLILAGIVINVMSSSALETQAFNQLDG